MGQILSSKRPRPKLPQRSKPMPENKPSNSRPRIPALAYWISGVVALVAISGYIVVGTPSYSIYSLLLSIRQRDVASAHRYMDLNLISANAADGVWGAAMEKSEKEQSSGAFGQIGQAIGLGLAKLLIPTIKKMMVEMITKAVDESIMGTGEEDPLNEFRQKGRFQLIIAAFSLPVRRTGIVATIHTREIKQVRLKPGQDHFIITLQRGVNRRWQITKLVPEGGWASIMKKKEKG